MTDLVGQPSEIRFTLSVTRKDTGKVEEYEMVGTIQEHLQPKEDLNECDTHDGSA